MRATRITFGCSCSGMKVFSAGADDARPHCEPCRSCACHTSSMPKKLKTSRNRSGGRITAISGSRPTMTVSVWWRVWLQRQVDRIAHDHEAGDLIDDVVHPARLERRAVAAFMPAAVRRRAIEHAVGQEERHAPPRAPERNTKSGRGTMLPSHIAVSRMAGPSERFISSFICLRGISV